MSCFVLRTVLMTHWLEAYAICGRPIRYSVALSSCAMSGSSTFVQAHKDFTICNNTVHNVVF
jgi:uncharacterized membrane protein